MRVMSLSYIIDLTGDKAGEDEDHEICSFEVTSSSALNKIGSKLSRKVQKQFIQHINQCQSHIRKPMETLFQAHLSAYNALMCISDKEDRPVNVLVRTVFVIKLYVFF